MALFLSAIFVNQISYSQSNQIELVNADLVTNSIVFQDAVKAIGNVHFKTADLNMYCDSAFYHQTNNWIKAYGRVQINQGDTLNLFSDSLHFDGNTNIGILKSNVRIRDNLYKLTTDSLKFNANQSKAYYTNWATIKSNDQNFVLTSIKGSYNSNTKIFEFKDSVSLLNPDYKVFSDTLGFNSLTEDVYLHGPSQIFFDSTQINCQKGIYHSKTDDFLMWNGTEIITEKQTIKGDSILFNERTEFAEGFGNITIIDTLESLELKSNYLKKEDGTILLIDMAQIIQYSNTDTLILQADTIQQLKQNDSSINIANSNVIIEKGNLIGVCDSLYFNESLGKIKMRKSPIIWEENSELSADSINIILEDNKIKKSELYSNAFVSMEHDSLFVDQLSGKYIEAKFDSSKIKTIHIIGNAETIYFPNEVNKDSITGEEIKTIKGLNHMISSKIFIEFEKSEINKISFIDEPDASFKPLSAIKQNEYFLTNYSSKKKFKPKSLL